MSNIQIETDLKEILNKLDSKIDNLQQNMTDLKIGQTKLEGQINAVDEKLSGQINALDTKAEQLNQRIANSEITNRGILIGLVVIILGGAAKLFGLIGNP